MADYGWLWRSYGRGIGGNLHFLDRPFLMKGRRLRNDAQIERLPQTIQGILHPGPKGRPFVLWQHIRLLLQLFSQFSHATMPLEIGQQLLGKAVQAFAEEGSELIL